MTWSERRKLAYGGSLFVVVASILGVILIQVTKVTPTCFDNKKNGDEVGVDCGGGCLQYCANELAQPKVRWVRSFEISPGVVHAVAYIEHSYPGAAAREAQYQFKFYDAKNSLITERKGSTMIGPMGRSAIVETLVQTGNSPVATTRFSFTEPVPWEKIKNSFSQLVIKTDRTLLEQFNGGTRLTATLENKNRFSFSDMEVVAILYDARDNAVTVSKTLVTSLPALGSQTIYFTWPQKIDLTTVKRIEVMPRINPFSAVEL